MDCRDITTQLADYLAGTLSDAELARVREHLTGCAACRDEVDAFDDMWQVLGTIPPERGDLPAMRTRFDAALAGYQQGITEPGARVIHRDVPAWNWPRVAFQAAAAVVLLATGVAFGRQTATPEAAPDGTDTQLVALRQELGEMRQMVTLSLLQQQSASDRLRGVGFTSQIAQPGTEVVAALLDALAHDQNVNVRLASVDALKRFSDLDVVRRGALDALPNQTSPMVQIALIDFLVESTGAAAAPTLKGLSADDMLDEAVRKRAAQRLEQLGVKL